MRIRFRGPSGGGFLELAEDATVADLLAALRTETGSAAIDVKFGWPLQTLAADRGDLQVRELGLQRENLTVVPVEDAEQRRPQSSAPTATPASHPSATAASSGATDVDAQLAASMSYGSGEDVKVEMPESRTDLGAYHRALTLFIQTTHQNVLGLTDTASSSCYAR